MKALYWIATGVILLVAVVVTNSVMDAAAAGDARATGGLPGARPVIEAAAFPSLQAALDAVPPASHWTAPPTSPSWATSSPP